MIDTFTKLTKLCRNPKPLALALILSSGVALSGCAGAGLAVVGAGTGVAMGTGVDYTLNGIAYKTFTAPMDDVKVAARSGLDNMGITITSDAPSSKDDRAWVIDGTANNRKINVELQALTPKTTRIRVVAEDGIFFKDKATAAEIIYQTADSLDNPGSAVAAGRSMKAPVSGSSAARNEAARH